MSTLFVFISVSFADPNIAASSSSATCKNSTLETYSGTSNLSANWDANTIKLHWYADDTATTELSGSGIPTSCVYDGALTPPPVSSIPQKTGYTFAGWKVRGLPDGYTKLQYIEFTGTQYIDTGVTANQTSDATVDFQSTLDAIKWIFGARDNDNGTLVHKFGLQTSSVSGTNIGKLWIQFDNTSKLEYAVGTGWSTQAKRLARHKVRLSGNKCYVDGNLSYTITDSYTNFTSVNTLLIGAVQGTSGLSSARFIGKIYSFVYYKDGALAFYGIPAKNSNNVVGMYDTVTKTFFTNAGTGTFTGPVAQ